MAATISDFLNALEQQTGRGTVRWTRIDDDTYRATVGEYLIRVSHGSRVLPTEDPLVVGTHVVTVTGPSGLIADEEEFDEMPGAPTPAERVFKAARRSAANSARVYDDLLKSLLNAG